MNNIIKWNSIALAIVSIAVLMANIAAVKNSIKLKELKVNQEKLLKADIELTNTILKQQKFIKQLMNDNIKSESDLTVEKVYVDMLKEYTSLLKITVEHKKRIEKLESKIY